MGQFSVYIYQASRAVSNFDVKGVQKYEEDHSSKMSVKSQRSSPPLVHNGIQRFLKKSFKSVRITLANTPLVRTLWNIAGVLKEKG